MAKGTLEGISYAELLKFQARLKTAIANKRAAEGVATKEQLRAAAAKAGFTVEELFGKRRVRRPRKVRYRNPKDPVQTWGGLGRRPKWLVNALKKGAKLEGLKM
ncbi:MAG: H-NS histone family protein [Hyphomicrobium sp.]|uniref:H-NS histone family protein n=1 Tax=Hyphomicrobium sp. TaxID=82 RepID=UPI0025C55A6C|nr:H-NS histone family protein [Hyphomicrobium sp.]MBZ0210069.1 H-NS histone family protein [Hyphomicrobium sp.]